MEQAMVWIVLIVLAAIMLLYYKRSAKPVKYFLLGSLSGVVALAGIQLFASDLLGLSIASIATSLVLGIPGVAVMAVMNLVL